MLQDFDIFLATAPGLEPLLADEAREAGFADAAPTPGGVTIRGGWAEVARANRQLRGATRVLARIASFPVFHLAQLDKRARKLPWAETFRPDVPIRIDVTCRKSKIYHAGAAAQRVSRAITEELGAPVSEEAALRLFVRIDDNRCTISVDTSGDLLHRRGFKRFVGKAPLRETQAALFLRALGWQGGEPLLDPMCGSGTFVIEAAEMATGLAPGRGRHFAFEDLAVLVPPPDPPAPRASDLVILGVDRDAGAVRGAAENAARAGVGDVARFSQGAISDLARPDGPPGLVVVNPPYGARIGNKGPLRGLYAALGAVLRDRFTGWRLGLVTSEPGLARATSLELIETGPPVPHGSLRIRLYRTEPLR